MFLESPFQADRATCRLCGGAAAASFGGRKQDSPPVGAFKSHGAIALAERVRNADSLDTVAPAEPRHFFSSSLHNASDADPSLLELGQGLAQLRKCFGIERSTEMAQPENQSGPAGPGLGEPPRLAQYFAEDKIRQGISDHWSRG